MGVLLSILIPTVKSREDQLHRLLKSLEEQILRENLEEKIEILVYRDSMENSVGYKANKMIETAKGLFVAGMGDDDYVDDDYCKILCETIEKNSHIDQITFGIQQNQRILKPIIGRYSLKNKNVRFNFGLFQMVYNNFGSIQNDTHADFDFKIFDRKIWHCKKGKFSHYFFTILAILFVWNFRGAQGYSWTVLPIKKEIAQKVKFTDQPQAQDIEWIMNLRNENLIQTEVILDKTLYYYHYNFKTSLNRDKHRSIEEKYVSESSELDFKIKNIIWL